MRVLVSGRPGLQIVRQNSAKIGILIKLESGRSKTDLRDHFQKHMAPDFRF